MNKKSFHPNIFSQSYLNFLFYYIPAVIAFYFAVVYLSSKDFSDIFLVSLIVFYIVGFLSITFSPIIDLFSRKIIIDDTHLTILDTSIINPRKDIIMIENISFIEEKSEFGICLFNITISAEYWITRHNFFFWSKWFDSEYFRRFNRPFNQYSWLFHFKNGEKRFVSLNGWDYETLEQVSNTLMKIHPITINTFQPSKDAIIDFKL